MAIAEPEPKKSDIAVASIGSSEKVAKNLGVFRNFKKVNGVTLSSTQRTVNTYDLYKDVKYFSFYMPDGWNENNIGIFLETCHENLDILKNPEIEHRRKWESIAFSGAMKSGDSTLFTINGCIAVAESLREYIASQENCLSNNDSFKKLRNDILQLLPHFSTRNPLENFQKNGSNSTKSEVNSSGDNSRNEYLEDMLIEIINKNISDIKEGNQFIWNEMSKKIAERIGISVDAKAFMTAKKRNIIIDMTQEEDLSKRKSLFIESTKKIMDVFDFIEPKSVTKSYYLSPVPLKNGIDFLNGEDGCSRNTQGSGGYSSQHSISDRLVSPSTCRNDKVGQSHADGNSVTTSRKKGRQRKVSRNKGSNKANDAASPQVIDVTQKKEFNEVELPSESEISNNLAVPSKSEIYLNRENDNITPTRKKNKYQVNRKNLSSQDISVPSNDSHSKVGQSSKSEISDRLTGSSKSGKVDDPNNENYNITQARKKHKHQTNRKNGANQDIDACSKSTHKAGQSSESETSDRLTGTLKSGQFDHSDSESNEITQTRKRNKHQVNRKNGASKDSNTSSKDGRNRVRRASESHISDRLTELSSSRKVDYPDCENEAQVQKKSKQQLNRNNRVSQDSDTCLKDGRNKAGHSSESDISDRLTGSKCNEQVHHLNSESNEIAPTKKKNKHQTNRKNEPSHDIYMGSKDKLKKSGLMSDSENTGKLAGSPKNNINVESPNIENNDRKKKKQVNHENAPNQEIDIHSKDKKKTRNSNEYNKSDNLSRSSKSDIRMSHPNSESNDTPQLRKSKQHAMNIKNVASKDVCSKDKLKAHLSESESLKTGENSDHLTNKEERKKNKQRVCHKLETKQDSNAKYKNNAGESCKYKMSDNSSKLSRCSRNTEQCVTENPDKAQNSKNKKEANNKSSESKAIGIYSKDKLNNTSNDIVQTRKKNNLQDDCKNTNDSIGSKEDSNKAGQTYESGIPDTLLASSSRSSRKSFQSATTSNDITQSRKKNKHKFNSKDNESQDSYSNDALDKSVHSSDQKIPDSLTGSSKSNKKDLQSEMNRKNLMIQDIDCISKEESNNSGQAPESRTSEKGPGSTRYTKQLEHSLTENKNFTQTKNENKQLEKNHNNVSKDAEFSSKEELNKSGPIPEKISEKGSTRSSKQLDHLLTESKEITRNKKKRKQENIKVEEIQDLFTGSKKKFIKAVHPSEISRPTKSFIKKVNNLSTNNIAQAKSSKKHQELFHKNERNDDIDNHSIVESNRIGRLSDSGNPDKVIGFTITNNKMDSNFNETKDTTKGKKKNKQQEVIHKNLIQDIDTSSKKEQNKSQSAPESNISEKVSGSTRGAKHMDHSPDNKDILHTRKLDKPQEKNNKNAASKDTESSSKEEDNKSGQTLQIKKMSENVSGSTRSTKKLDQSLTENKDILQTKKGNKQHGKNHKNDASKETQNSYKDEANKSGHIFENVPGSTRNTKKMDHSLTENQGTLQTKKENKQQDKSHKNAASKNTEKSSKEEDKKSSQTLESKKISENVSGSTRSTKKLDHSLIENQGILLTRKENKQQEKNDKSAASNDAENSSKEEANKLGLTLDSKKVSEYVSEPTRSTQKLDHALTENKDFWQTKKENKQQEKNHKTAASRDTEDSSKDQGNKLEHTPESKISDKVSGSAKSIKEQEHSLTENKDIMQTRKENKQQEKNYKTAANKDTDSSYKEEETRKSGQAPESKTSEKTSGSTRSTKKLDRFLIENKDIIHARKENKQQEKNNKNVANKYTDGSSKEDANKSGYTSEIKISDKVTGSTIKQQEHSLAENKDIVQTRKENIQQEKSQKNVTIEANDSISKEEPKKSELALVGKDPEKVSGSTKSTKQVDPSLIEYKDIIQTRKENKLQMKKNKNVLSEVTSNCSIKDKSGHILESKSSGLVSGSTRSIKNVNHSPAENGDIFQTRKGNNQQEMGHKNVTSKDGDNIFKDEPVKSEYALVSKIPEKVSRSTKSSKQLDHPLTENKDVLQNRKDEKREEKNHKKAGKEDTENGSKDEPNESGHTLENKISEKVSGSTRSTKKLAHSPVKSDIIQTRKGNEQQEKSNKNENAVSKDSGSSSKGEPNKSGDALENKISENVSGSTRSSKKMDHSPIDSEDILQTRKENKQQKKSHKNVPNKDTDGISKEEPENVSGSTSSTKQQDHTLTEDKDITQTRQENKLQVKKKNDSIEDTPSYSIEDFNKSGHTIESKNSEKVSGSTRSKKQLGYSFTANKDDIQISNANKQQKIDKSVANKDIESISRDEPNKSILPPESKITEKVSGLAESKKRVNHPLTENNELAETRKKKCWEVNQGAVGSPDINVSSKGELTEARHLPDCETSVNLTRPTKIDEEVIHNNSDGYDSQHLKKRNKQCMDYKNVASQDVDPSSKVKLKRAEHSSEHEICTLTISLDNDQKVDTNSKINDFKQTGNLYKSQTNNVNVEGACSKEDSKKVGRSSSDIKTPVDSSKVLTKIKKQDLHSSSDDIVTLIITRRKKEDCKNAGIQEEPNKAGHSPESNISNSLKGSRASSGNVDHGIIRSDSIKWIANKNKEVNQNISTCSNQEPNKSEGIICDNLVRSEECIKEAMVYRLENKNTIDTKKKNIELDNKMVLSQDVDASLKESPNKAREATCNITETISFEQMGKIKKQQEYYKNIENQDIDNCSKEEHGKGVSIESGISGNLICSAKSNKKEHLSATTINEISPGKGKRKRNHTNEEKQVEPNKAGCSFEGEIYENLIGPSKSITKLDLPCRECNDNQVRKKRKQENPVEPVMDYKGTREFKYEANKNINTHSTQGTKRADHLSDSEISYDLIETKPSNIDKPLSESIVVTQSETNKYDHVSIKNKTSQQDLCSLEEQNKRRESLESEIFDNLIRSPKSNVTLDKPVVESNGVSKIKQNEEGTVSCTKEVNQDAKTCSFKELTQEHSPEYEKSDSFTNSAEWKDKKEHPVIECHGLTQIRQEEEEIMNQKNAANQSVDSCSVEEPKKVGQSSENEISHKLPGPTTFNKNLDYAGIDRKVFDIRLKEDGQMNVQSALHQTIETFSMKGATKGGEESSINEISANLVGTICIENTDNPVTECNAMTEFGEKQEEELKGNLKNHSSQNVHPCLTEKRNKKGDFSVGEISNELPESTTCNVTEVGLKEGDLTSKSAANHDGNAYLMGQHNRRRTSESELSDTMASSKKCNYTVVDPVIEISSNPEIKQNKKKHLNCTNETNQDEQLKVKDNCLMEEPQEVVQAIKNEISDNLVTSITCNVKMDVPIIENNDVLEIQQKDKEQAICLTKTNRGVRLTEESEKGDPTESDISSNPVTLSTYDIKLGDPVIRSNDVIDEAMNETNQDVDVNLVEELEKGGLPESEISDNLATATGDIKLDNAIIDSNGATRVKQSKEEHMDVSHNTNQDDASLMGELNNYRQSPESASSSLTISMKYNVKVNLPHPESKDITNVTKKQKHDQNCLNVLGNNVDSDHKTIDMGSCSNDELSKTRYLVESEISDYCEWSSDCNKETDLPLSENNVISQVRKKFKSKQANLMNTVIDNIGSDRIGDLANNEISGNLKDLTEGREKVDHPCSESNGTAQIRKRRPQTKKVFRDVINAVGSDCGISFDIVASSSNDGTTSSACKVLSNATGILKQNDLDTISQASVQVKQSKDEKLISDALKTESVVSHKSVKHKHQRKRSPPPTRSLPYRKAKMKQCGPKTVKLISDSQHYIDLPENIHELCTKQGIKFNKKPIIKIKPLTIKTLRKYDSRGELKEYLLNNESCSSNYNPPQSLRTSNDQLMKSVNSVVKSLQANCSLSKDCLSTTSNLNIIPTDAYVPSSLKDIFNSMGTAGCSSISSRGLQNILTKPDSGSQMIDRNSLSSANNITPVTSNTGSDLLKVRPLSSLQDIHSCKLNPLQEVIVSTSPNSNDIHMLSNNHMHSNLMQPEVNQLSSKTCPNIVSFSPSASNEIVVDSTSTSILNSISKLDPSKIVVKTSSTFKESSTINSGKIINKPLPPIASKSQSSKPPSDRVGKPLFQSKKTNVPNDTVLDPATSSHDILSLFYVPKPRNVNFEVSSPEITSFETVVENREDGFLGFVEPEQNHENFETSQRMVNIDKEVLGFHESDQRYENARARLQRKINVGDRMLGFRSYQSKIALLNRSSKKGVKNEMDELVAGPSKHSKAFYDLVYARPHSLKRIAINDCSLSYSGSPSKRQKIVLSEQDNHLNLKDSIEIGNRSVSHFNWNCLTGKSLGYKSSQCRCLLQPSTSSGDPVPDCNCKSDDPLSEGTILSDGERSLVATTNANLASFVSNAFEEMKSFQEWKFEEFEKMQKEIASIEEQKVSLLQKVLHGLSPSEPD